jgi:hypothetical protein
METVVVLSVASGYSLEEFQFSRAVCCTSGDVCAARAWKMFTWKRSFFRCCWQACRCDFSSSLFPHITHVCKAHHTARGEAARAHEREFTADTIMEERERILELTTWWIFAVVLLFENVTGGNLTDFYGCERWILCVFVRWCVLDE